MAQDEPLTAVISFPMGTVIDQTARDLGIFDKHGFDPSGQILGGRNDQTFTYYANDDDLTGISFTDDELAAAMAAKEETPPNARWTTTPRELIRDGARPIYTSTTPDVALTPRGSATPPIPYDTWARPTHPLQFPSSVRATGNNVMVLRSQETLTYGAEQGVALGVKSGTILGPVQPLDHSTNVRAEGSYVIRDGDAVWMNNRNNLGVANLEGSTVTNGPTPPEPEEEPGFWEGLWDDAKEFNEEYKIMQRGVGALQTVGGALEAVGGGALVVSGAGASATGVGALAGVPAMAGGGVLAAKGADDFWAGLQTLWTGEIHDTYLDTAVAGAGEALGVSDEAIMIGQTIAGAAGNPANILKEGGERVVREGVEEGAERVGREVAEETAEASAARTARVSANCYSTALAAMILARANGVKYVGGPHGTQTNGGASGPVGDGLDSHHVPPNSVNRLPASRGPAIQMEPGDHYLTASNGKMAGSRAYNASQGNLVRRGKAGFLQAVARDVADIRAIAAAQGDPTRYDVAIGMMLSYAACLAASGELD